MPFDADSGLVYSEKIIIPGRLPRDGSMQCTGRPPKPFSKGTGSDALVEIAMRKLLRNLNDLDANSLSNVPDILLEKIWKAILRRKLDSLHVWRAFAQSSIGNRLDLSVHTKYASSIDRSIQMAHDKDCAWLTTIDIVTDVVSNKDIVRISEIHNLRSLRVGTCIKSPENEGFNDRILRTWADQARQRTALRYLKSIFLYYQEGVTGWSLGRLSAFPALEDFCAYKCDIGRQHLKSLAGWRDDRTHGFRGFMESKSKPYGWCYYGYDLETWNKAAADYCNKQTSASQEPIDQKPVLNVLVNPESLASYASSDREDMICLQRCPDVLQAVETEPRVSTSSKRAAGRAPPIKKRKLVTDSAFLEDMF